MRKILSEPLLHFLLIGFVLFLVYDGKRSPAALPAGQAGVDARIVISENQVASTSTPSTTRRKVL